MPDDDIIHEAAEAAVDALAAVKTAETQLIIDRIDHVERDLTEQIEKISLGTLVGKWVGEHMMATGIGAFVTILTFVGTIVTGTLWVDGNYVDAAEMGKSTQQIQQSIGDNYQRGKIDNLEMRRWYMEQRLQDLEAKPNKTQDDRARIEQMKREIANTEIKIREAERKLESR